MFSSIWDFLAAFEYHPDGRFDTWRILKVSDPRGDCDDAAVTMLYILCGHSLWRFWYELIFADTKIHYCEVRGLGHAVLYYQGGYIDNIQRRWCSRDELIERRYNFKYGFYWPQVVVKMLMGKIV